VRFARRTATSIGDDAILAVTASGTPALTVTVTIVVAGLAIVVALGRPSEDAPS